MTTCPNVPLFTLGIMAFRVLPDVVADEFHEGRAARIANQPREACPWTGFRKERFNWLRGWDVVDFALNHPDM